MNLYTTFTLPLDLFRDRLSDEERAAFDALRPEELSECLQVNGIDCRGKHDDVAATMALNFSYDKEKAATLTSSRTTEFQIAEELKKITIPNTYKTKAEQEQYKEACKLIMKFGMEEYGNMPNAADFEDPTRIGLAYTTLGDEEEHHIQAYADLVNLVIIQEIDGMEFDRTLCASLKDMIVSELRYLTFDELVRIDLTDEELEEWLNGQEEPSI